jgi:hypothetical protein
MRRFLPFLTRGAKRNASAICQQPSVSSFLGDTSTQELGATFVARCR